MMRSTSTGKLLSFPLSKPVPEACTQMWNLEILRTKDNLENALDYLRAEYNAMLAGEPITAADEIMARVETILKNNQKVFWYAVVAKIRIHSPTSRDVKRKAVLPFPVAKALQ